jgi:hypothetical protein
MGNALNFQKALVHTLNAGARSVDESSLLDVVETVLSLNNSVNERVESGHVGGVRLNSGVTGGSGLGISEELSTETVVRVVQKSVLVVSVHGGGILAEELSLEVVHLSGGSVLNGGDLDVDSEGVSGKSLGSVEEISERGGLHVGEFGGDLGDNDGVRSVGAGKVSLISSGIVGDLGEVSGGLRSVNESADVGVVRLAENVLGTGLVGGDGSDVDGVSRSEVGELQLGAEGVPGVTGVISKSDLVGVFIELVDLGDSSLDIKVLTGSGGSSLVKGSDGGDGSGGSHVRGGPLSEGSKDVSFVLLERSALVGVGDGGVASSIGTESGLLIGGEKGPRSSEVSVEVELLLVIVHSHGGSVDSDDISESVDNWEVLKSVGEDDEVSPVVLLAGSVEGVVNDLERADESVLGHLVGEGSVDDDTVDVVGLSGDDGGVVKERVVSVLGGGSGSLLGGGLGSSHICCGYLKVLKLVIVKEFKIPYILFYKFNWPIKSLYFI